MKLVFAMAVVFSLSSCATIVNDSHIPLTISFSDGSSGECTFKNKRGVWTSHIPTTSVLIRRSDDALVYDCTTKHGEKATGSIRSEMEGGKLAASIVFWDLGITDSVRNPSQLRNSTRLMNGSDWFLTDLGLTTAPRRKTYLW